MTKCQLNSFALSRDVIENSLYMMEMANNVGLFSIFEEKEILDCGNLLKELDMNYDKFYDVFER